MLIATGCQSLHICSLKQPRSAYVYIHMNILTYICCPHIIITTHICIIYIYNQRSRVVTDNLRSNLSQEVFPCFSILYLYLPYSKTHKIISGFQSRFVNTTEISKSSKQVYLSYVFMGTKNI